MSAPPRPKKRAPPDYKDEVERPRKREERSPPPIPPPLPPPEYIEWHKDQEFWYDDGTLILVARHVEFRVYSGILADHSPVLKELFAQTHPTRMVVGRGEHTVPCPVVQLPDSPEDLRHVLRVYMPRKELNYFVAPKPTFHMLSALIRLGHKYEMAKLYTQSLQHLKTHFTTDFDRWKRYKSWPPAGFTASHAVGVVNLARLTGEASILPTALLACIFAVGSTVVHGYTREDGTQESLALNDLALCFAAKTRLTGATIAALMRIFHPDQYRSCLGYNTRCKEKMRGAVLDLISKDRADAVAAGSPFLPYTHFVREGKLELCNSCLETLQEREKEEQREIWGRLPELLGIQVPGWPSVPPKAPPPPPAVQAAPAHVSPGPATPLQARLSMGSKV